jgi:hypothetical protein
MWTQIRGKRYVSSLLHDRFHQDYAGVGLPRMLVIGSPYKSLANRGVIGTVECRGTLCTERSLMGVQLWRGLKSSLIAL